MKKFRFSLQKLLDIREAKENEIKNELMKVISLQNKERVFQDELRAKVEHFEILQREKTVKGFFSAEETMFLLKYKDVSARAIIESERRIDELQPEVEKIREKLVAASRDRKIVEKLKDRRREEFEYELNRELAKENDDMNQKLYHRKLM